MDSSSSFSFVTTPGELKQNKTQNLISLCPFSNQHIRRAKFGQIQGGGVAEGQLKFDKGGGVAIIFYFLHVKNIAFYSFYAKRLKKGLLLRISRYKKVSFQNFFVKRLKKIHI